MLKENIPKFFYNLGIFATRPFTLQSQESRIVYFSIPKIKHIFLPLKNGVASIYADKDDCERAYSKILERLMIDYDKESKNYKKYVFNLNKASNDVKKSVKKSNKEKLAAFKSWLKAQAEFFMPVFAPFAIEEILDPKWRELLKIEFGVKSDEYFEVISSPTKLNDYQKMRLDILGLVISNKVKAKNIEKLVKKYGWYSEYSYIEHLLDKDYFENEIKKLNKQTAKQEKMNILDIVNNNRKKFNEVNKKIKNPELKLISLIINDYTFIRTDRIDQIKKSQVNIRPFYQWLGKELTKKSSSKWEYKDTLFLLNDEIINFLKDDILPEYKEVKKRINKEYILYYDRERHMLYNPLIIKEVENIISESEHKNEIKGTIVHKGIVSGIVNIVSCKDDLNNVKADCIFVAKTTMPEYTPKMRIAKAFVTDEGGITSHAAIIARELKIPCIVGTKNATKMLKNGDFIEVDAINGIVKIIKRK